MPCKWQELSFGVEIEFTFMSRQKAAIIVSDFFETSYLSCEDTYDTYEIEDYESRTWKILRDGSLIPERKQDGRTVGASDEYKVELVTPILYYYSDMLLLQDLVRKLRKSGARVNNSCGFHIHVGAENFDAKHLRILCNLIYSKQNILERAVKVIESRKRYCNLLSENFIEELNKKKPKTMEKFANIWYGFNTAARGYGSYRTNKYHASRYVILNLHNLLSGRMSTVEFRIFNSTLHAGVLKSYIQFCLLITAQALNQSRASWQIKSATNDKWSMRIWLLKLGFIGDEFKTARYHLTKLLSGNSAWRDKS